MTSTEIQAFLTVHRTGSISQAAEQLYISQSSLSSRLHTLEQELDCKLFVRGRGSRTLTLSPEGERFLPLARQHRALEEKMSSVAHPDQAERVLRLSALGSISYYLLPPVYERFSRQYPNIRVELRGHTTQQARQAMAHGKLDLAFSALSYSNEHITTIPLAREPMAFLCSADSDYPDPLPLSALSPDQEVYSFWCADVDQWHRSTFGPDIRPLVRLELSNHIRLFTSLPGAWCIVPESIARALRDAPDLRCCRMAFPLPPRPVNILCRRESRNNQPVLLFLDCLREVLTQQQFPGLLL